MPADITNFTGFMMRGAVENPLVFWLAILPMLPGVNGASASAVKVRASTPLPQIYPGCP